MEPGDTRDSGNAANSPALSDPHVAADASPPAGSALLGIWVEARRKVEEMLSMFPANASDPLPIVSKAFWPNAIRIEAEAVAAIAQSRSREAPWRSRAISILTRRVVAEGLWDRFWSAPVRDGRNVIEKVERINELLEFECPDAPPSAPGTSGLSDELSRRQEEFLRTLRTVLAPPSDRLESLTRLAHRLGALVEAAVSGALACCVPPLTHEEARILDSPSGTVMGADDWRRICLEAVALRSLMTEDREAWDICDETDGSPARGRLVLRMHFDRILHDVLRERFAAAVERVRAGRADGDAGEHIGAFRRSLFASYSRISPILELHAAGIAVGYSPESESSEPLLARIEVPRDEKPSAPAPRRIEKRPDPAPRKPLTARTAPSKAPTHALSAAIADPSGPGGGKVRLASLVIGGFALAGIAAAVLVHSTFPRPSEAPLTIPAKELRRIVRLDETQPAGTMLYARTTNEWTDLTDWQRVRRLRQMGELASQNGFEVIFLVDPAGARAGSWTREGGVVLPDSET